MDVGTFVTGALANKNMEEELRLQQLAHEQKMKQQKEQMELDKERAEFQQQLEEKAFIMEDKKRKALLEYKKMEQELVLKHPAAAAEEPPKVSSLRVLLCDTCHSFLITTHTSPLAGACCWR